jgi:CubicO group peptidase (beta-lactamase class C family)
MTLQPNPDLQIGDDHKPRWNSADRRRHGFHNLHRIARYVQSFRAGDVLMLRRDADLTLAARPDVARLTGLPFFSAMVVLRGDRVLFERYAPDFGPDQPHSIMSISKTTMMLIIGRLVAEGRIDLAAPVDTYLPWAGPGYAKASVQDVLNMNVDNDYVEDYADPLCAAFLHEAAIGLRLPNPGQAERTSKQFLATVGLAPDRSDTHNRTGLCMYRSANTDILAAIAEAVGGPLAARLADIADAAGLEGSLHVATDRSGFPCLNGGLCLTARDLARYGLLLARGGIGVAGQKVGSPAFLQSTLAGGVPMPAPRDHLRYSNQTNTDGRWIGHGGYGGQYLVADPVSGTAAVFLSVLDNADGYLSSYYPPIIALLAEAATAA